MIQTFLITALAWWTINPFAILGIAEETSGQDTAISPQSYRVVLDPKERTTYTTHIVAEVRKVNVKLGSSFKKGDVLVQFDDTVFKGVLQKAQSSFEKAYGKYKAKQDLYKENIISLSDLKEAKANATAAQADLISAKKDMEDTQIIAPYDGEVASINVREHELPQRGDEILEIIDDAVLVAKLILPSAMLSKMKVDDPISIKIAETGETITAKIKRIGSSIDASSSTIKVEAEIENPNRKLTAGMTGIATLKGS